MSRPFQFQMYFARKKLRPWKCNWEEAQMPQDVTAWASFVLPIYFFSCKARAQSNPLGVFLYLFLANGCVWWEGLHLKLAWLITKVHANASCQHHLTQCDKRRKCCVKTNCLKRKGISAFFPGSILPCAMRSLGMAWNRHINCACNLACQRADCHSKLGESLVSRAN